MNLDEVLRSLNGLSEADKAAVAEKAAAATAGMRFLPNPGPQTDAWFSKADVLLYGGEPGGGKSGLICGLALEEHRQSLIMRRIGTDLEGGGGLIDELLRLYGSRDGFSGKSPATLRTDDDRIITFGAATHPGDEQKFQGRARDLLGLDEATQFTEAQVRFLMAWVRTVHEGQRTRTVLATNPPMTSVGDWVIGMFRPWLDPTHHNPAKHGELRWYITDNEGDHEVDGPDPVERDGEVLRPSSRTFIPAELGDNPYIVKAEYQKMLDSMPAEFRHIRDGNFMASRRDDEFQVIPSAWAMEAQRRWTEDPPEHAPMTAIGVDVAQGGADSTVIASRYDGWFDHPEATPGSETPTGAEVAGLVISKRRNGAAIVVDMGGGYGGDTAVRLKENGIEVVSFKGGAGSSRRSSDQAYKFTNKRAESYWRLREALDPGQDGGSPIALPPDPELIADLTAPRLDEKRLEYGEILVEPKAEIKKRLGRSPDKGDAVVMCWSAGPKLKTHGNVWRKALRDQSGPSRKPKVILGHQAARRRR